MEDGTSDVEEWFSARNPRAINAVLQMKPYTVQDNLICVDFEYREHPLVGDEQQPSIEHSASVSLVGSAVIIHEAIEPPSDTAS